MRGVTELEVPEFLVFGDVIRSGLKVGKQAVLLKKVRMHVRVSPNDGTDEVAQDPRVDLGQAAVNSGKSSIALAHD